MFPSRVAHPENPKREGTKSMKLPKKVCFGGFNEYVLMHNTKGEILCWCLKKQTNNKQSNKQTNKETKTLGEI